MLFRDGNLSAVNIHPDDVGALLGKLLSQKPYTGAQIEHPLSRQSNAPVGKVR